MKKVFDGLISRLHIAKERLSELEDILIGIFKSEKSTEKH
jgi:hypothetical protein